MTSEELIEKEANERYPDRPVVLGRGNTCLSCGEVQREAFKAGVEWYRNQLRKDLEDGIREINEKGFATFLKNHQSVFVQDANGDMMRKVDDL